MLYKEFIVMACQSSFFTRRPDQNEDIVPEVFTAMKSYFHNVVVALGDSERKGWCYSELPFLISLV